MITFVIATMLYTQTGTGCEPILEWNGNHGGDGLGLSITSIGDLNGDGVVDIAISEPGLNTKFGADVGGVLLCSGADGSVIRTLKGYSSMSSFGRAVADVGDVDADGVDDLGVGAWTWSNFQVQWAGSAYVFSGKTGELLFSWYGSSPQGMFGASIAAAGDVNDDGYADVLVGAPGPNVPAWPYQDFARVYSGRDGSILATLTGDDSCLRFGFSVARCGDLDGDGKEDLFVGSPWASGTLTGCGKVVAFSSKTFKQLAVLEGSNIGGDFGQSVSRCPDIDGDGISEVVVGAFHEGTVPYFACGAVHVYSGANLKQLWHGLGHQEYEFFGWSVGSAGDFNADGVPDIIVGAYGTTGSAGYLCGKAYVLSGSDGQVIRSFEGDDAGYEFGSSVGGVGDINKDGFDDVIIGSSWPLSSQGLAVVISGGPRGDLNCDQQVSVDDLMIILDNWGDCSLPTSCNGDINADGLVDIDDLTTVVLYWSSSFISEKHF